MRALIYLMDWTEATLENTSQLQGFCNHRLGLDEVVGQQISRIRKEEEDSKDVLQIELIGFGICWTVEGGKEVGVEIDPESLRLADWDEK